MILNSDMNYYVTVLGYLKKLGCKISILLI